MKIQILLTLVFSLCLSFIKAQTVSVSADKLKISFMITDKTTNNELKDAMNVFSQHGIAAVMKATWQENSIVKLKVSVTTSNGSAKYKTDREKVLRKGVKILVDHTPGAAVALSVGPE